MVTIPAVLAWLAARLALVQAAGVTGLFSWLTGRARQALTGDGGRAFGFAAAVALVIVALVLGLWWLRADAARDARKPLEVAIARGNADAERLAADLARKSREAADAARRKAEAESVIRQAVDRIATLEQALAEARASGRPVCVIPRAVVRSMRRGGK